MEPRASVAPSFSLLGYVVSSRTETTAGRRRRASKLEVRTGAFSNGIAYDAIGTGPRTVVFLPGGPGIVRMAWARVRRALLEPLAVGGCTVWRLTRRRDMPSGHTVADMADDVAQVIDEAFGGHVDAVAGLSLGGMIAQFLGARHPDAMGRVVLLSSAATATAATVESARRAGEALGRTPRPARPSSRMSFLGNGSVSFAASWACRWDVCSPRPATTCPTYWWRQLP
jgi:pimeloyl-ACP methyl ester carboxylesterase